MRSALDPNPFVIARANLPQFLSLHPSHDPNTPARNQGTVGLIS